MADFVAVPSEALEDFLKSKKFTRSVQRKEVVYSRTSVRCADLHIKVYTSIRDGQAQVRKAGKDAIRVCTIFDDGNGKSFGVGKFSPVLRVQSVESVLGRLEQRMRQAAARGNEWLEERNERFNNPPDAPKVPVQSSLFETSQSYKEFLSAMGETVESNDNGQDPDAPRVCTHCKTTMCPDGCCCAC